MLKQSRLKPVSAKRKAQMLEYEILKTKLRNLCGNKSELSGNNPTWESDFVVEPHHIDKRFGKRLLNPFFIIMLTRSEHDIQEGKVRGEKVSRERLLRIVLPLRISQGFRPEGGKDEEIKSE